jgi:hypothetical protein
VSRHSDQLDVVVNTVNEHFGHPGGMFELHRDEDETGVSGTGVIAWGVEFPDGTVALRWATEERSTSVWASIRGMESVHGHNGKTRVVRVASFSTGGTP